MDNKIYISNGVINYNFYKKFIEYKLPKNILNHHQDLSNSKRHLSSNS